MTDVHYDEEDVKMALQRETADGPGLVDPADLPEDDAEFDAEEDIQ